MAKIYVLPAFLVLALLCVCEAQYEEIGVYELKKGDFFANFTNYGAVMLSLVLPDKTGMLPPECLY